MRRAAREAGADTPFSHVSMIDIVFLILIFFMCTIRFKQMERRLDAWFPNIGPGDPPATSVEDLTIYIKDNRKLRASTDFGLRATRKATYYLNSRDATPVTDMALLQSTLMRLGEDPDRRVLIAPYDEKDGKDQLVPFFNIIRVVDACKLAGLCHIRFQAPAVTN